MKFEELLSRTRPEYKPPERLIALDPGETTGFALFENGTLIKTMQLATKSIPESVEILEPLFDRIKPTHIVYEDYKVYEWKSDSHSWSSLHTPQLIGCIETLCTLQKIPFSKRMAQHAKGFCTDKKLREWNYYEKGLRHGRDAIRHGCFYLLFANKSGKKS